MLDHDEQLLESLSVRRQRLTMAFLFGRERRNRKYNNGIKHAIISLVVAALICAGCVGYSFIMHLFQQQERQRLNPHGAVVVMMIDQDGMHVES
ncbi:MULTISPECIES: hypothetical protein [Auritidibacter]|uniref:hypothetical protein n=1 Tax=Auritidibacter TaxID=1160973 RepID=UPI001AEF8863|nr:MULTISPECIES: hypothetical protein [Auritidibacter]WGH89743.1 hypothetical protein QDX23_06120 [Auritidibacter ignavus]